MAKVTLYQKGGILGRTLTASQNIADLKPEILQELISGSSKEIPTLNSQFRDGVLVYLEIDFENDKLYFDPSLASVSKEITEWLNSFKSELRPN